MFAGYLQPAIVSLFSSTGSDSLNLFSVHEDQSPQSGSLIHLLHDTTNLPCSRPSVSLLKPPMPIGGSPSMSLDQTVLQIQSHNLRNTFIRCPRSDSYSQDLSLKHPWLHIQVRNMQKEWSFEIGLVDQSGRRGVVRCSTFQVRPFIHIVVWVRYLKYLDSKKRGLKLHLIHRSFIYPLHFLRCPPAH